MRTKIRTKRYFEVSVFIALVLGAFSSAIAGIKFPGLEPGAGQCGMNGRKLVSENAVLTCQWDISEGRLKHSRLIDKLTGAAIDAGQAECFQLVVDDGQVLRASELRILGMPQIKNVEPDTK